MAIAFAKLRQYPAAQLKDCFPAAWRFSNLLAAFAAAGLGFPIAQGIYALMLVRCQVKLASVSPGTMLQLPSLTIAGMQVAAIHVQIKGHTPCRYQLN